MIGLGSDKNWKNTFMNNCIQVINWCKKPVQENETCNHDNEQIKANRYQNTISVPICPSSVIIDIIPFVIVIIIVLEIPVEVLVCLMKRKCVKAISKILCVSAYSCPVLVCLNFQISLSISDLLFGKVKCVVPGDSILVAKHPIFVFHRLSWKICSLYPFWEFLEWFKFTHCMFAIIKSINCHSPSSIFLDNKHKPPRKKNTNTYSKYTALPKYNPDLNPIAIPLRFSWDQSTTSGYQKFLPTQAWYL